MSLGVVTGIADRACAFVLAGYCGVTALLWKQFWKPGDFWASSSGKGRSLFWDFLKNFALGAGFLLITFGTDASWRGRFFAHPLASSHPYRIVQTRCAHERRARSRPSPTGISGPMPTASAIKRAAP